MTAVFLCAADETPAPDGVAYSVTLSGFKDKKLEKALKEVSDAFVLQNRPPATPILLQRRAERDVERMEKVLRGQGYYDSQVAMNIDDGMTPATVDFAITLGKVYTFSNVEITDARAPGQTAFTPPSVKELGLDRGRPAEARAVVRAQAELELAAQRQGYAFPKVLERRMEVDHANQTAKVRFTLDPGAKARFGATTFSGLDAVEESYPRALIPWQEGDPFNGDSMRDYQKTLADLGLFSSVRVSTGDALDAQGAVPIQVTCMERKPRTIGTGLGYDTDEGVGGRISWENRNLFGEGERLKLRGTMSEIEYSAEGQYRKPAFLQGNQTLQLTLTASKEIPDAFESRSMSGAVELERAFSPRLKGTLGVAYRNADIEQFLRRDQFSLISFPASMDWDASDDPYDPGKGVKLRGELTPFWDVQQGGIDFVKGQLRFTQYLELMESPRLVLANRALLGAAWGSETFRMPADERFYAGGGSSIRGYPYQSLGPRQWGKAMGGRSVAELGTEMRIRVTDRMGLAAFLEGGTAMDSPLPDFHETLRWGAGLGARYYTPVGPIRLDVGVPINPPSHVHDDFQVYLSLGHAF